MRWYISVCIWIIRQYASVHETTLAIKALGGQRYT